jgi:predicted outer membrane repeat protein
VSAGLNSTISIINSTFVGNTAFRAGGAIATAAGIEDGLIITNSVFDSNAACVDNTAECCGGGAVAHTAFANISNSTFHNNSVIAEVDETGSFGAGGALFDFSVKSFGSADDDNGVIGRTNIELCNFTDNCASKSAGAAYLKGNVTLNECLFEGNSAEEMGAVYVGTGLMTITRSLFANNTASSAGGAVANFAIPPEQEHHLIEESTFFNNSAGDGGALISSDEIINGLVVRFSNFSSNTAVDGNGGAINCGDIRVGLGLFTSNKATAGGAIIAVRFAYVPVSGSSDPGTSRASLVRLLRLCPQ